MSLRLTPRRNTLRLKLTKNKMKVAEDLFTINNILSPQECQEYIALTEQAGYCAATITTNKGFELRPDIRNNERVILDDFEIAKHLWQRVTGGEGCSRRIRRCF